MLNLCTNPSLSSYISPTEGLKARFTVADPVSTAGFTGTASYYIDDIRIEKGSPLPRLWNQA